VILREALLSARERLRASGSDEPEIEAEVLLRHALDLDRATFLRLLNEPISTSEAEACEGVLYRRFQGEPTAYITGRREFRGLVFKVTPAVLIPRPETEMLVEAVAAAIGRPGIQAKTAAGSEGKTSTPVVVDVGTGSGAIAIVVAKALPSALVYATDVSPDALAIARENGCSHGVERRIVFRRGHLLEPLDTTVDVIAANLPYVTERDWQQLPVLIREHEPRLALASGEDGLDAIRALLQQAPRYLRPGGSVFLEFGIGQAEAIEGFAREAFPTASVDIRLDFAGIPRLLVITSVPGG
jgi:release factor glutamine methyltransferase